MERIRKFFGVLNDTFAGYKKSLFWLFIFGSAGALLDGIGINSLIPLLSFVFNDGNSVPQDTISSTLHSLFSFINIPFSLKSLLIFMSIIFILRAAILAIFAFVRAKIYSEFIYGEMNSLLTALTKARWSFLIKQKAGFLQNTLFYDVKQTATLLDVISQFIQSSTGFVIYFAVAMSISPIIMTVTMGTGIILLFIMKPLVRKTASFGDEKSRTEKIFSSYLIEHVLGLKVIKASGVADNAVASGRNILARLRDVYAKSAVMTAWSSTIIQPFSVVFILILFAFAYKSQSFSIAAFAAVLYLIQKIFVYLQSTQGTIQSIADMYPFALNITGFKRLLKEQNSDVESGTEDFLFRNELSFKDVSFSYSKEVPILKNISFTLKKQEFLGIIGPSGGGKTSITDLILRLFGSYEGTISLDGILIHEIKLADWQKNVGFVSQDIFMMNDSVMNNIRFYDESITTDQIHDAARKAHIYDEIMRLEFGFDTVVGDRGTSLSVGQRQRIVLARALARKLSILILDEATSSLDSESESKIKDAIEDIRKNMTLIVIAHRLSTITNADKILVLKDGGISEYGKIKDMQDNPDSYLSQIIKLQNIQ